MFRPGRVFLPPEVLKGQRGDEAGLDETSIKRVEGESSLIISSVSSLRVYLNSIPAGSLPDIIQRSVLR